MPAQNITLVANFEMLKYILTLVTVPEEGGIVTGSGEYNVGEMIQLNATPNADWEFVNWTGDVAFLNNPDAASATVTMPAQNITIVANFKETVTSQLSITVLWNPSGLPVAGAWVELVIISTDEIYSDYTDQNGLVIFQDVPAGNCVLYTMKDSHFLQLQFEMEEDDMAITVFLETDVFDLSLNVNPSESGTITGTGQYAEGEQVNINATANPGWEFVNWTGDVAFLDNPGSANATVTMPAQDIALTANFETVSASGQPCPGTPNVTDIDGNTYNTVLIGDQCWMKENLKTTKYRNNTSIDFHGNNDDGWFMTETGAYAWYNNDISWKHIYGALYNWWAATDENGLCPTGWHTPNMNEWQQMVSFLGENSGGKLKSTKTEPEPHPRWNQPNVGATNETGFTAFPNGKRDWEGYNGLGTKAYYWTSNEMFAQSAILYSIGNDSEYDGFGHEFKLFGFAVRCIKNN